MRAAVVVTVRCPVDGPVPVTVFDVAEVIVRSGSDVRAILRCPRCGAALVVTSDPEPGFVRWLDAAIRSVAAATPSRSPEFETLPAAPLSPYVEYFRRELDGADTVDEMLALMDLAEHSRGGSPGQR